MPEPILLLDTNNLCHRAHHAMEGMFYGAQGTAAIFGVLRDILTFQESFKTSRCMFMFDGREQHRYKIYPAYKSTRKLNHADDTEEEKAARVDLYEQIDLLGKEYLPQAGFRNVYKKKGLEADDLIAGIAEALPEDEEAYIISSDEDLFRCLRPNVHWYSPHRKAIVTLELFRQQWGIEPEQWTLVKALAGCTSDDVPGVAGVGEPTAAKYLRGEMNPKTMTYEKIEAWMASEQWEINLKLVGLPYPGTPVPPIREDEVTESKWQQLADRLGMKSIRSTVPRGVRRSRGRKRDGQTSFGFDSSHRTDQA